MYGGIEDTERPGCGGSGEGMGDKRGIDGGQISNQKTPKTPKAPKTNE